MAKRICSKTGLALTAGPVSALRIARESYGPFDPLPRDATSDVEDWSRYDTIGRTIYATADKLTAFMELLAPYRTDINGQRRALQPLADFMGVLLEDLWRDIVSEWDAAGTMKASWLPRISAKVARSTPSSSHRDGGSTSPRARPSPLSLISREGRGRRPTE